MVKNIAIIDLDSVIFTAFHGKKVIGPDGEPLKENGKFVYEDKTEEEVRESCDDLMNMILRRSKATHYIAFVKGKCTTTLRLAVHSEYKGTRSKESPKWWGYCKAYLIDKWKAVEANDYEVDDYVLSTYQMLPDSFIVAIDKDLLSLATKDRMHYNWKTNKWEDVSKEAANYKFWTDMIVGQSGDNIKGIPGKGEKFAGNLFKLSTGDYPPIVLVEYIKHFGEAEGIKEFYKNYTCLKILDKIEGFVLPEINEYKKDKKDSDKFIIDY